MNRGKIQVYKLREDVIHKRQVPWGAHEEGQVAMLHGVRNLLD